MEQNNILRKSGWYILSILTIMPLILWLFGISLSLRLGSLSLITRSLGDVAGLCGMASFSLVMILSARLKFFEKFFNGINESYTAHHIFGGLAFCLLLFHPLLLAYNYLLISFNAAALFLIPSANNWAQNFGTLGLFIMIVTLVVTFYTKIKYQIWKFTHKFLGIAFILAFLHTFLIGGDVSTNFSLKIYLFILGILAIITYFYRTLFADYLIRVFDYTIKGVKSLPDKIWEIEFESKGRVLNFSPGQFAFIKLYSAGMTKELHPFSFSSASGNPLKIAVKELGDYTNKIGSLKIGDLAKIEGPFGSFNYRNFKNDKQIWIAGGIGITPFLSMARSLTDKDTNYKIDLYYSVKNESCLAFEEELEEISKKYKNINIIFWDTERMGFLNANVIKEDISNIGERDIFICGPSAMMAAMKNQFLIQGVEKNKIHLEEFKLY